MSDEQYRMACVKAAIGMFVICRDGPGRGLSPAQMAEDMGTVCNVLADGLGLPREQVSEDVMREFDRLPGNPLAGIGADLDTVIDIERDERVIN